MSYILDALQRADAERERAGVPGLHAHPVPLTLSPRRLSVPRRAALATLALIALGMVAGGLWAWRSPVTVPVSGPAPVPMAQATPVAAPPPLASLAPASVAPAPVARVVVAKPVTAPTPVAKASEAVPATAASVPLLSELPEDVRRQIPALTFNGAVYSENPAQRLLLLNGQVLSQGSLAAPDVTLERIGANQSEFNFRGTRFRVAH
jgi:general secretion pathway protein B